MAGGNAGPRGEATSCNIKPVHRATSKQSLPLDCLAHWKIIHRATSKQSLPLDCPDYLEHHQNHLTHMISTQVFWQLPWFSAGLHVSKSLGWKVALVLLQIFAGELVIFQDLQLWWLPVKSQQLKSTNGKSQRVMEKVTVNGKSDMGRNIFDSCGKREKLY